MLDPDVLDIDAGLPGHQEQPCQLAGLVADDNLHDRVVPNRRAALAGNSRHPRRALLQQASQQLHRRVFGWIRPTAGLGEFLGGGGQVSRHVRQDPGHRRGVGYQDLRPQSGIALSDPGHVAQSLARQAERTAGRVRQLGRHGGCDHVRRVRYQGHPAVMLIRADLHRLAAAAAHQVDDGRDRLCTGLRSRADHPWAAEEQVGPGGGGTRTLPSGQRVAGHEGGKVATQLAGLAQRERLHAGNVGVPAGQTAGLGGRERGRDGGGRNGEHRQIGPRPILRPPSWWRRRCVLAPLRRAQRLGQHLSCPEIGGELGRGGVVIGQPDGHALLAQGQRDRRPDQAGPDHDGAAQAGRRPSLGAGLWFPRPRRHWAMSSRRAVAPRRYTCWSAARGLPVSTCMSSRTTRGMAPGTSISLAHSNGTS